MDTQKQFEQAPKQGTTGDVIRIANPYIMMYEEADGRVICRIHRHMGWTNERYGLLICDLVRHMALAFKVQEETVWEWIDRERRNPTAEVADVTHLYQF